MTKKPELLSPAGTLKAMRYALAYGADAVYGGQPRYSLRVRNNEFNLARLAEGIDETHRLGKKFYIVANIIPHNNKLKNSIHDLKEMAALGPDALIMSDPGLIMQAREALPDMPIHLSVQANTTNWASAEFWRRQGLARIILSRELALEEVAEIIDRVPEMEFEVFVHGAICMAYSGRCLLAGYFNRRDPNQGVCTNVCRWNFKAKPAVENDFGAIVPPEDFREEAAVGLGPSSEGVFTIEESSRRPGEYMPVFEDQHGCYILNSRDLRAVEHVPELVRLKVSSLKIEGRTKSYYYAARTTGIYRQAIDQAVAGNPFNPDFLRQLDGLANRGYTDGFLRRQPHQDYQNYEFSDSLFNQQRFVGELTGETMGGLAEVVVKNRFEPGDSLELFTPQGQTFFTLEVVYDRKGRHMAAAPGDGHVVYVPVPEGYDPAFALLAKNLK